MGIKQAVIKVTTTGDAGSAVGSTNSAALKGKLIDIYLDYHASAPNTTDVTISYTERGGTIAVNNNSCTDVLKHPRAKPVDNANAEITNAHDKFALNGRITVAVAQCDALTDAVTAYVRYED